MIFHSHRNGLDQALIRVGKRVLIDEDAFNEWLERGRRSSNAMSP